MDRESEGPSEFEYPREDFHEKCQAEADGLRKLLEQHNKHWRAVSDAFGLSFGGVDCPIEDPHGNAGTLINFVDEVSLSESERLSKMIIQNYRKNKKPK